MKKTKIPFNYTEHLINKAKSNNTLVQCDDVERIQIIYKMNKNLEIVKHEYKIKQIQSIESASKITLTNK